MEAPAIRVTCECGQVRSVPYGERWQCERCGRSWNTEQIPPAEYRALTDAVRRYRRQSLAFVVAMLGVFAPLALLVDMRFGVTGLVFFFAWALFVRPRQRRRLVATIRGGSRWQLHAE